MHPEGGACVGPNAITQTAAALLERTGVSVQRRTFEAAGLETYLDEPPGTMIPERDAAALFGAVIGALPELEAVAVLSDSGRRTGDYIAAHRIPALARSLLHHLPPALSGRLLLRAIVAHAWTFAGSGRITAGYGNPLWLEIAHNPLAIAGCPWHRAVLARLFGRLVSAEVGVHHPCCCATGAACCRFEIRVQQDVAQRAGGVRGPGLNGPPSGC